MLQGDWSSDVCSSDLAPGPGQHPRRLVGADDPAAGLQDHGEVLAGPAGGIQDGPAGRAAPDQIGRASCRERGQTLWLAGETHHNNRASTTENDNYGKG